MERKLIKMLIRGIIKEHFDKSEDVAPATVNNLPGKKTIEPKEPKSSKEPLVPEEPLLLTDKSKPEELGDPVIDIILNSFLKAISAKGKSEVAD